jgi:hypothetical protein
LLRIIGAKRIITNIKRNFNTGFVRGKVVSNMFNNIISFLLGCYVSDSLALGSILI